MLSNTNGVYQSKVQSPVREQHANQTIHMNKLIEDILNDFEKVNPILIIMAQQGDGEASYRLGMLYYKKQTKNDCLRALEWFKYAILKNYGPAFCQVGQMYQYGKGVLVNHDLAIQFYLKAASLENSEAKYRIGCMYHYGIGRPFSYAEAFQWYSKAANQNNPNALNGLGYLYEKGQGVKENQEYALYWYKRAAKEGNETALARAEKLKNDGIKEKSPVQKKALDFNQTEVLKTIKALLIADNMEEQVFTKKLESIVMERKFKLF